MRFFRSQGNEVIWEVDIPPERQRQHDPKAATEPNGLAHMPFEGTGAVGELKTSAGPNGKHVGAGAVAIRGDRDAGPDLERIKPGGERQVAVSDDDLLETIGAENPHPFSNCAVQSGAGRPDQPSTNFLDPFGNDRVIADDGDRHGAGRPDDMGGHRASEFTPMVGVERGGEPNFGAMKGLDRHEHDPPVVCRFGVPLGVQLLAHCRSLELRPERGWQRWEGRPASAP